MLIFVILEVIVLLSLFKKTISIERYSILIYSNILNQTLDCNTLNNRVMICYL